jgi:four helix bundle protein
MIGDERPKTEDRTVTELYKFQQLKVYQMALEYVSEVYELCNHLPDSERYNLQSQLQRSATSIVLNIAEGSTGQSDPEQLRFLGHALRSYLETIACFDLIDQRNYLLADSMRQIRANGHQLFIKLQAFRNSLKSNL